MVTKVTRDVMDGSTRPVKNFVLDGTGTSSIDGTPIGTVSPDVGIFTNISGNNLTISTVADFSGATIIGLQSYYADVAEYYEADEDIPAGTVVKLGGPKEIQPTEMFGDSDVFGVISTNPAFVMNQPADDKNIYLPVVLVGRIPCRVIGPVQKGCRLIADAGGVARSQETPNEGLTFARSLVDDPSKEERLVEVAIVTVK